MTEGAVFRVAGVVAGLVADASGGDIFTKEKPKQIATSGGWMRFDPV